MARKRCQKKGHRFSDWEGLRLPYVFCIRWGCGASAVSSSAKLNFTQEELVHMHNAIPREKRWPPVELYPDGTVKSDITEPM